MTTGESPLLAARDISKRYPGVQALAGVSLNIRAGRLNALLGENGAGKSTLMGVLTGCVQPDSGELRLDGQPVHFPSPRAAQEAGIAIIHQELNLAANLTVAENMFLGREPLTRWKLVDHDRMLHEARAWLAPLAPQLDPAVRTDSLSIAEQQTVEIAKALSLSARVLILDEPTSALTHQEATALFGLIKQLKSQAVGMVYITHRLDELAEIADDVTILRDGQFIGEQSFAGVTRAELVRMMVGRDVEPLTHSRANDSTEVALEVRELSLAAPKAGRPLVVKNVSLSVTKGEIVGLFGLMGAGRTELLEALFGVYPSRTTGEVIVGGVRGLFVSPQAAIQAGLALAPEDRKRVGLHLDASVTRNVALASQQRYGRSGFVSASAEERTAGELSQQLQVKMPSLRTPVRNLSGGNQQKVVLAKWLATNPRVLMVDEPTRGVDVGAKGEIHLLLRRLAAQGVGILLVSSELPEVLAVCDRILVLRNGELSAQFAAADATEEKLLTAALPVSNAERHAHAAREEN